MYTNTHSHRHSNKHTDLKARSLKALSFCSKLIAFAASVSSYFQYNFSYKKKHTNNMIFYNKYMKHLQMA